MALQLIRDPSVLHAAFDRLENSQSRIQDWFLSQFYAAFYSFYAEIVVSKDKKLTKILETAVDQSAVHKY